jgi:hypothetical protein
MRVVSRLRGACATARAGQASGLSRFWHLPATLDLARISDTRFSVSLFITCFGYSHQMWGLTIRASITAIAAILLTCIEAHAEGCTPNHELYRIVPEYRAILLDGGNIERVMFVDAKDERLSTWKPDNNITFCPDEDKMINTTTNSVVTLLSEIISTCNTLLISDAVDRALEHAWKYANVPNGDPSLFVDEAKSRLGWFYEVCTDHLDGTAMFRKDDFKLFTYTAASLTKIDMAMHDPANEKIYKERAEKYEQWGEALLKAESKKSWLQRLWQN